MNPLSSANDPALLATARNTDAGNTGGADFQRRSAEGDLAWQRAFEQARRFDVSGWFAPPGDRSAATPIPKSPTIVPIAPVAAAPVAERASPLQIAKGMTPVERMPIAVMHATATATGRTTSSAPVALAESENRPQSDSSPATGASATHEEPMSTAAHVATTSDSVDVGVPATVNVSSNVPVNASFIAPVAGLAATLGQALSMRAIPVASLIETMTSATSLAISARVDISMAASEPISAQAPTSAPHTLHTLDDDGDGDLPEIIEPSDPPATRAPVQGGAPEANESLRVYAEWSAEGVRVWLGANPDAARTVQSLAPQLQRWLAGEGERLVGLTCNGRALWSAALPQRSSPTDHSFKEAS